MRSFFRVTGSSGRASLAGLGVIGAAGVVLLVLATLRSGEAAEAAGSAPPPNPVPGMASLSGTVTAPSPFTAARVYIRNEERGVLYQVFTQRGRYRAVALFPGEYEVSASVEGLESEIRPLTVKAGDSPTLDLALRPTQSPRVELNPFSGQLSYEEVYPPGPGRDVLERTCMICHGEDFASSRPTSRQGWEARVDYMQGRALWDRHPTGYAEGFLSFRNTAARFGLQDREVLLDYLAEHFGPDAKPQAPRIDVEMPLNEEVLGKAMFIEYYFTRDPEGQLSNDPEFNSSRRGQDPRFDAEGNVWQNDRNFPHRLIKLNPRTGEQKEWLYPDPKNGSHEVLIDPTGIIWLPEHRGAYLDREKRLLGFNPKTETFDYVIPMDPDNVIRSENKFMQSLAMDSKMNIYVGWIFGGALSKYERATGKVTVYPLPVINAIPYGVVVDSKDRIFIGDYAAGHTYMFDTENEQWTTFTPLTYPGQLRRPNVDYEDNVWYPLYAQGRRTNRFGKLGKIDTKTGKIVEWDVPRQQARPYDVSPDPFGNIWIADAGGRYAALLKFDPRTETFTMYPKPQPDADTPKVQVTRDGAIWFSPRGSRDKPAHSVLYPDMDKITSVESLGAYYVNGPPGYPFSRRTTDSADPR